MSGAIAYEYDAKGTKLKKTVSTGVVTEYEEDEIYVNGNLYQISHDEGRIANGIYEYNITDHLGNLRVAFKDSSGIAVATQSLFYDPWGLSMKGMQVSKNNSNFNKFQYNGKEIELETGWSDYGARMYAAAEGRWWTQDLLAEASEDFTPYQYGANNPILNIDLLGLTDVNGDKKDDGTLLPEVVVRGKRNTSNLDNAQLALDIAGLYPGLSTIAGVANAGIDIYRGNYGSAGLNLLSAVPLLGTAMKGTKLAVLGTKAISSMAKMKVVKAGIIAFYSRGKVMAGRAINSHHIIPEKLFKRLKNEGLFDDVLGFDVNAMYNRMDLPGVGKGLKDQFHGKHPDFTDTVESMLRDFASQNGGKLTPQDINKTILHMEQEIKKAYDNYKVTGQNLNQFFK